MKIKLSIIWLLLCTVFQISNAQEDVALFNYWKYFSDSENSQYKYFCDVAFKQLNERKIEISKLNSKEDWLNRQALVREKLSKVVGPFPEKTALNAQITGVLQKDGYRIEKVIYESIPGYFVTGALFIPDGIAKDAPAVFYACGHTLEGFRASAYQHIMVNLVKKGFVVFTIDPMGQGERYEYWDPSTEAPRYRIPDHEHSYAGAQCLLAGYSTGRYFIWDIIRGIDYMLTRKEIDPKRLGMTGRSGGGNTSAYLGALDDRLHAVAPECYITSHEYLYKSIGPQCAEQNLYQMIAAGLDHADFIEARAPKPTMIIATTRDFFSIQGTRESYGEAKKMYQALDSDDMLSMVEDDNVHTSTKKNREAMYAFFQEHLNNPGSPEDLEVTVPGPEELQVCETGQLVTSFKAESVFSMNAAVVRKQTEALEYSRINDINHLQSAVSNAKKYSGFMSPAGFGSPVFSGRSVNTDHTIEKYLIPGSGDYMLPAVLMSPLKPTKNILLLMIDAEGMQHAVNNEILTLSLLRKGYQVLLADLTGIGSMGPGYLKGDSYIDSVSYNQWFAAILAGKTNVGLRAEDIVRIVEFAKNSNSSISRISVLVKGPIGGEVLHAAAFDKRINSLCLIDQFMSYSDIASTRFYSPEYIPFTVTGGLHAYDLPDLMAHFCPGNMLLLNPRSGDGTVVTNSTANGYLRYPAKVFSDREVSENFRIKSGIDNNDIIVHILDWLD